MEMIVLLVMVLLSRIGWEMDLVLLVLPFHLPTPMEPVVNVKKEGYSLILIVIVFQVMNLMFKMVVLSVGLDSLRIPPQVSRNVLLVMLSSQIPPPMDQHQPPIHLVDVILLPDISTKMEIV